MILSIESSCDDSSLALTRIEDAQLIAHFKISQEKHHSSYGGVVPELASRLHAENLPLLLERIKISLNKDFSKIKAIAITNQPGLSVTLIEGLMMAKALSLSLNLPLILEDHLRGHVYSLFINEKQTRMPLSVLLVSGGHSLILEARNYEDIKIVATSLDDSFGESFDKVSKMLDLGYPGGPIVEKLALDYRHPNEPLMFPVPLKNSPNLAFSFSGLKNAVRLEVEKNAHDLNDEVKQKIGYHFQSAAIEHLIQQTKRYFKIKRPKIFGIVGGASQNLALRKAFENLCAEFDCKLVLAPLEFCSDNAAMIGRSSLEAYQKKRFVPLEKADISPRTLLKKAFE
ncbi:tRNA (adenosine(37)-N6)-threonylcarbamoyltransferase complex transferase subunit TsaD [Helicobacter pylori]|uniref:tRNA (adenosine(37)-N6)-threonylcarbamoyltransferase complex transferase subunit TsaD n=1 Tax=Helicobacter pylori TaxID=210 RepID=UPI000BE81208|nr:tRNA (adenosine(37)-N6)-threonylcarbamoyltransferase complex transferase subunit TsaD [Helicobacter pylori]PDX42724.1 tRNA N6-adenosine(37)-threonylcarbamoyltransferase complex transferase subunit TsaD [Helicobacter pylori]